MNYSKFLKNKAQVCEFHGFDPVWMPDCMKDFQKAITEWNLLKGRSGTFADCGLGKTLIQLVWAENVARKHNGKVLILTPLAVSAQTQREAEKFSVEAHRVREGKIKGHINITNYEQLQHYDPNDFIGCVCDESSILKNFKGKYKGMATEFMRKMSFRLLCTATAAPNDYTELGTSSEALGELGFLDMLKRYFKNDQNQSVLLKAQYIAHGGIAPKWSLKGHAEEAFWKWVCSWARAVRKPSDLGFSDEEFILPELNVQEHVLDVTMPLNGYMFPLPASNLNEQRNERRLTINERCEAAAGFANAHDSSVLWCHLNPEGDLLEKLTNDCVQVCGSQKDEQKEENLLAFLSGQAKRLVTKSKCAGLGLNMQHCAHMTFFPSHSYEQYYQSVRRCWRFGQKRPVTVDIITTEGEARVMSNLKQKADAADVMFTKLVGYMNDAQATERINEYTKKEIFPKWLAKTA